LVSVVLGTVSAAALAQQQQGDSNRQAPPPPPRPAVPIPQDSRVPLPPNSRAPLGSTSLRGLPPASERARQGPVDPPRNNTPPPRPGSEPQDVRADIARARQLEADARRRYGLDGGDSGGGNSGRNGGGGIGNGGGWTGRPWPHHRRYRGYYPGYYYSPPYVAVPYDTGGYTDPGDRREWVDEGVPPADAGQRNAGGGNANRGGADAPPRVPNLPPDELLGDDEMTPALQRALDASTEWKQATADLILAWGAYADAVDAVLGGLQDKPEYRRARAELLRTKARLDAAQAAAGAAALRRGAQAAPEAPPEKLVSAADEALKARRAVQRLEAAALESDPDVQRAQRRLDNAIDRRNEIREKIAAKLPAGDRPAEPKRPKLLEDE
jgi:hypothetical protein